MARCQEMSRLLGDYYREQMAEKSEIIISKWVHRLENETLFYASKAPISPYESKYDFGIYLLQLQRPENELCVLVGYTTLIAENEKYSYRVCFFLRGNEVVAVKLEPNTLKIIFGRDRVDQGKPDLYIWYHKLKYLDDYEAKKVN